jgi:hypothetical protein
MLCDNLPEDKELREKLNIYKLVFFMEFKFSQALIYSS